MTLTSRMPWRSVSLPRRLFALSVILAACGGLALLVDLPLARWLADRPGRHDAVAASPNPGSVDAGSVDAGNRPRPPGTRRLPGDLVRIVNLTEVFGYSPTAGLILLAALLLDPALTRPRRVGDEEPAARAGREKRPRMNLLPGLPGGRWSPPALFRTEAARMAAVTFSGGLATDVIKMLVTRVRPYAADLALHTSAIDTFSNVEGVRGVAMQSFPSGHAAVAAGLTSALCWRYPRGAPLFIAVGIAAAAQRLTSGSHYGSDVAVGAAIALAWAAFWLRGEDSTKSA